MKTVRYTYLLTLNDRKRHEHVVDQGRVSQFVVQYETFIAGRWYPVLCYDTARGFPHVDRIRANGTVEKVPLLTTDLGEALTFADQDIDEHWERYKEQYLTGRSS
jgi:hypothetical protein